jgi:hypothetical protein
MLCRDVHGDLLFASSLSCHCVAQRSHSRYPGPLYSVSPSTSNALVPLKPALALCGEKLPWPWPTLRGSKPNLALISDTQACIPLAWSHKVMYGGIGHSQSASTTFLVAYLHDHDHALPKARLHPQLHSLVLPLSLSAQYHVSTSTSITACFPVSSPPPPSLSPSSGLPATRRH